MVFVGSKTGSDLESSPTAVRPWAQDHYQKLTTPVRSPGKPTDPQYMARHGGSSPSTNPNFKLKFEIHPPATEYVADYEVVEFDAAEGFTAKSGSGSIHWLAAKPYDLPPDDGSGTDTSILDPFHPDGSPMSQSETTTMEITKRDLEAWGLELNDELGTAMKWHLVLAGFENPEYKFRGIFDASTHVSLDRGGYTQPENGGRRINTSLGVVHDAPLLVVIDLAHGETQDFTIPVAKGAILSRPEFSLEVIDVLAGTIAHSSYEPIKSGKAIMVECGISTSPGPANTFSVICQISPPSMTNAVSVDAIDAAGNVIENRGRAMEDVAPASRFAASLATATSLRVRYRPHQTRLLLKLKSVPGVTGSNLSPGNLFDVQLPQVTFRNSFSMRRFISTGSQLKDITGSWSGDTTPVFPLTLTKVSPRDVAERYLSLDPGRRIIVVQAAMTIEFEPPKKTTLIDKVIKWFKRLRFWP